MLNTIKNTVNLTHVSHNDGDIITYDFSILVYENTFKFEVLPSGEVDVLYMNGEDISVENLRDMFFKVDYKMMSLGAIFRACDDADLESSVQDWINCDMGDEANERSMKNELSSPQMTGRV